MFKKDLNHLLKANTNGDFKILKEYRDHKPGKLNVILSVEGAHSFQDKNESSIIANLKTFKKKFRFHHLTLTHLTRQPACVHCFGVKMKMIVNMAPDINFRPDPKQKGISPLGKKIIHAAYDGTNSPIVLIDIKHMSYLSRKHFYKLRERNNWGHIPLIVSHAGVTGSKFSNAVIAEIKKGSTDEECDEIFWCTIKSLSGTNFNPWTINLFDEDIEQVIKSKGMIGISLDERILGFGRIFGEYMSKEEVKELQLENQKGVCPAEQSPYGFNEDEKIVRDFFEDPDIQEIDVYEMTEDEENKLTLGPINEQDLSGDLLFDLDKKENEEEEVKLTISGNSHIDYLACNILHIIKVGLHKKFDGTDGKPDVTNCICLGSDLDGIVDAMTFPFKPNDGSIDQKNRVTVDKYSELEDQLKISMSNCLSHDYFFNSRTIDVPVLIRKVMYINGIEFLKTNFN